MRFISKIIFSTILVFAGIETIAQQSASQLLEKVIEKTRSHENIRFDFSYQMLNERAGIDETKTGVLYLNDVAYRLEMEGQQIISDGKLVWTYLEDSQEVMITEVSNDEDAISPNTLLTTYNKAYKASYINNNPHAGSALKAIELKPEKPKSFYAVQLIIDESKLQIVKLIIIDNGGNTFIYDLSKMKVNNALASGFFSFDVKKYPDVEVIDMR